MEVLSPIASSPEKIHAAEACEPGLEVHHAGPRYISPLKDDAVDVAWTRLQSSGPSKPDEGRILGLRTTTFWLVIALVASISGLLSTVVVIATKSNCPHCPQCPRDIATAVNSTSTTLAIPCTSTPVSDYTSVDRYYCSNSTDLIYQKCCTPGFHGVGKFSSLQPSRR